VAQYTDGRQSVSIDGIDELKTPCGGSTLNVMRRRSILAILGINVLIPLFFGAFVREQFVGLFNPYIEMRLGERFLFSIRPVNIVTVIVFGVLAHLMVMFCGPCTGTFRVGPSCTGRRGGRRFAFPGT